MELQDEITIPAPRGEVYRALNDVAVLKACIPGCDELEREGLIVDEALKRAGQLVYLPNVSPSRSFYQFRNIKGARHAFS